MPKQWRATLELAWKTNCFQLKTKDKRSLRNSRSRQFAPGSELSAILESPSGRGREMQADFKGRTSQS